MTPHWLKIKFACHDEGKKTRKIRLFFVCLKEVFSEKLLLKPLSTIFYSFQKKVFQTLWKILFISSIKLFSFARYAFSSNFFPFFPHFSDSNPAGNYMFKVNNRNTRTTCEICSKLTIKTQERRQASFWCLYC